MRIGAGNPAPAVAAAEPGCAGPQAPFVISRRGALAGCLGLPLLARAASGPADGAPVRARQTLKLETAQRILAACREHAAGNGWSVAIAVVDEGGALMVFERLEGALP